MKKFQFKFETVLKVKENKEQELKKELLKLIALKTEQEMMLNDINLEKKRISQEKLNNKSELLNIQSYIFYENYINSLRRQITSIEKVIKELEKRADDKREEVIEASKEKKIFEKLKERHYENFKKLVIQNEQKVLDEIAIGKFNRKEQRSV